MDASRIFLECVVIPLMGLWLVVWCVQSLPWMCGGASSLLHGSPGTVCSPVTGVEATSVRLDQASLPLSMCPAPKKVGAEASEVHAVSVNLSATMAPLCSSSRPHPFLCCDCPRSSARLWCGAGWSWGSGHCGCRSRGGCGATWTWAAPVVDLSGAFNSRSDSKLRVERAEGGRFPWETSPADTVQVLTA